MEKAVSLKSQYFILACLPLATTATSVCADYTTDIGYEKLEAELGLITPNGSNIKVTQVEASSPNDANPPIFAPDPNISNMEGKIFTYPGLECTSSPCEPTDFSSHATGVANRFYGNTSSISNGITDIHSYEANQWLSALSTASVRVAPTDRRIANHSWVGYDNSNDSESALLRQVDRQVDMNEYIQIAATTGQPLISSAYNVIAVGLTNSTNNFSTGNIDSFYPAGRVRPDIVAPASVVSTATPTVAAATALLVETGHNQPDLSLGSRVVNGVGTIYNAERAETIKAILMAGADRHTANTSGYGDISDYGDQQHQTANGLDSRYGAGQIDIYNSYQILTGGEQNSLQDNGFSTSEIGMTGFDYDASFGGANNSNDLAIYSFSTDANETLRAALVWNANVTNNREMSLSLPHMQLSLIDVTNGSDNLLITSQSLIDNTQNIFWQALIGGHDYELRVSPLGSTPFEWDYALAWHRSINTAPVPVPAAFWLFGSAFALFFGWQRQRPSEKLLG